MDTAASQLDACTNCSEKDTITIAGKSFCANCGTPQTTNSTSGASQPAAQQSASTPSLSVDAHTPSGPAPLSDKMPTNDSTTPVVLPTVPVATNVQTSPQANQLHTGLNSEPTPSITKFSTSTSDGTVSNSDETEMESLEDKNGESVMSDETLDELSQATKEPMPPEMTNDPTPPIEAPVEEAKPVESSYRLDLTRPGNGTLPKAVSDVRPSIRQAPTSSAVQSVVTVAPVTPSVASPAPIAPAVPTTAPQSQVAPAAIAVPTPGIMPTPQPTPVSANAQSAVQNVMQANAAVASAAPTQPAKGFKAGSVALSLAGLLLVGAYIWQVNYPSLALKVAGSKAGISANFPGYVPNGWKLSGNIQSSPGNISYNIADEKAGKSVAVTEAKTNWDSQALAENYVTPKSSNYLALQAQGLTIYLYDGNQASWVNNGTWYRVEGINHGLTQDQIIKLATSL